jgi:hypothetical protein
MRKSILILITAAAFILAVGTIGTAQMMHRSESTMPMNVSDSTNQSYMMGPDNMAMMDDLSSHYNTTIENFQKLESNFDRMMKINDMDKLKTEMKKYRVMLKSMHKSMIQQEGMFNDMMSSIETQKTNGMMNNKY